jgi:Zn-dependent protease
MTWYWTVLTVLLLLGTMVGHEVGHAAGLRRIGVPVVAAGFGLPFPPKFQLAKRTLPDGRIQRFYITPWLLGAWVQHDLDDDETVERAKYVDHQWYNGAGIVVNLVLGAMLFATGLALTGRWVAAAIYAGSALAVWLCRRSFAAFVLPALAVPNLVLFMWSMMETLGTPLGPVGLAQILATDSAAKALIIAGIVSVSVGLVNTLPLIPLDGGKLIRRVVVGRISPRAMSAVETAGLMATTAILVYVVLSDLLFAW